MEMVLKLAVVALSGCDGCQYNLVTDEFFSFLKRRGIEISYWPLVGASEEFEASDVTLVEGSVISERDVEVLKKARERSKYLVAMGTCALLGGVQGGLGLSKPVGSYVSVDHYVRGCPVTISEVVDLLDKIALGRRWRLGESRFEYVERGAGVINDGLLSLDQDKCIVCGRCIDVCARVGAKVLNYTYRGINTLISTPYGEPFGKSGCVYCGLCAAYCPVGAISYKSNIEKVISEVSEGSISEILVEPEALAALAESENITPLQVVEGLRILGFRRVVVFDPLSQVELPRGNAILLRSPAERELLQRASLGSEKMNIVDIDLKIPPGTVYLTQCFSWRFKLPRVITSREIQLALRRLNYATLRGDRPDEVFLSKRGVRRVSSLEELRAIPGGRVSETLVFELCPGGCLLGGGQPVSDGKKLSKILEDRKNKLQELLTAWT
jgi:coenzyme F420-reducing hydrogenase gamma subunit